jgi:glucosamine--fructose-6-phosphate aminotransferase (isomerizing)
MAKQEEGMNQNPMLDNIYAQPASLKAQLALQEGSQRSALLAAAKIIREAKGNVIFTGMGGSLFATVAAVSRLLQQGLPVQSVDSSELLHYGAASLRAGDVGVVISRSGGSIEPVALARKMRQAGMKVIGFTNVPGSELERLADVSLMIGSLADKLIAVQTYTGTVLALLLLAEAVLAPDSSQFAEACSASLPVLAKHIEECVRASEGWQDLLVGAPLYLLGRGASMGSIHEGALLIHETAKTAAVGMSCGQFRHGPAEILASDFRAVVFGAPEATRALDRSLANDLFSLGAKVGWIGPGTGPAPSLVPWPAVDAWLAPIFEIVPIQLAAYRLALWRGVTPGDFRFVSEVTATESGFLASTPHS